MIGKYSLKAEVTAAKEQNKTALKLPHLDQSYDVPKLVKDTGKVIADIALQVETDNDLGMAYASQRPIFKKQGHAFERSPD